MNGKVFKRLIATVLTGVVLLSSTGVYTVMSYATEDNTNATDVVTNDNNSTTESGDSATTTAEETTKTVEETTTKESDVQTTETTTKSNNKPVVEHNDDPDKNVSNGVVNWIGVNGTANMGSESNPYAVSDIAHFLDMSNLINDIGNNLKYFKLTANIDLSSITLSDFTAGEGGLANTIVSVNPTLSSSNVFFVLDGSNFNISNLTVSDSSRSFLGIFGYLNSKSVLKNINFQNITMNSTNSSAYSIGTILKNEGIVSDCTFTNITVSSNSNDVSDSFTPITDSLFKIGTGISAAIVDNLGTFTSSGIQNNTGYNIAITVTGKRSYVGGLVSQNTGKVSNIIVADLKVSVAADTAYVGGLVGANFTSSTSYTNGIYESKVSINKISGGNYVGGITGKNTGVINYVTVSGTIKSNQTCTSDTANIVMIGGNTYGAITAVNTGVISKCSSVNIGAYFSTTAVGGIYGGIAGTNTYLVQNSVATGSVTNNDSTIARTAGGIVGLGSTENKFVISNCYALVKLPETTTTLGSIVGTDGDAKYLERKITACYYSSIISGRPAPTSYTGTGAAFGDLQYSMSVLPLILNNAYTLNYSALTYSGWGTGTVFNVKGSFVRDQSTNNATCSDNSSQSYVNITALISNTTQTFYYGVDITLPEGVGNSSGNYILSGQQFILKTIHKSSGTWSGNGTTESPFEINITQLDFLRKIPYGHFKFVDTLTYIFSESTWPTPITFWGSVDFNNRLVAFRNRVPLFKGIYGSRDDQMSQNDVSNHKSTVSSDTTSNQMYGVVKNLAYNYADGSNTYLFTTSSAIFGNICNATAINVKVTGNSVKFTASSANQGVVFNGVYGNSYLYGCYTNLEVSTTYSGQSAFISYVDAENAIIDNCGSNSKVVASATNLTDLSAFIGNIKKLGGYVQNCYSSGAVKTSSTGYKLGSNCYLFASKSVSTANIYNCYYSPSDYYSTSTGVYESIPDGAYTGTLSLWSFKNSVNIVKQPGGVIEANDISNMDAFSLSVGADLTISNLTSSFSGTSTGYSIKRIFMGSTITLNVGIEEGAVESSVVLLTHPTTGLVARATIITSSDLEMEGDYYLIKKPTDLYIITSEQGKPVQDTNGNYQSIKYIGSNYKFKLAANIDMSGLQIDPWGKSPSAAFMGELTGPVGSDGKPLYTISGLNFSGASGVNGFFRYVSGAKIENINFSGLNVSGGLYVGGLVGQILTSATITNCHINGSVIKGKQYLGGLVGGIDSSGSTALGGTITNCSVNSTNITSTTLPTDFGYVGGIIGSTCPGVIDSLPKYAIITNCKVDTVNIYCPGYTVGGIVGLAGNNNNLVTQCTVNASTIKSDCTATGLASVAGIAGLCGGNISQCTVSGTSVTGSRAAGIVTYLTSFAGATATVSECTVGSNSQITSPDVAAGIYSTIGAVYNSNPVGDKVLSNCTVDASTIVTGKVAGGIFGTVYNFNGYNFTIDGCKSLATVTSTGAKASKYEGAGAIIGRLESSLNTSGIKIKNCVAGGKINGVSSLGGIIGLLLSNTHSGSELLIQTSYITAEISQQTLQSYKGLIVGYVGTPNSSNFNMISSNSVVYSSYGTTVQPYGNVVDTAKTSYTDVNGSITATAGAAFLNNVVSGNGTNMITVKPSTNTVFTIGGVPTSINNLTFSIPASNVWTSQYPDRATLLGTTLTPLRITTTQYKVRSKIYTTLSNSTLGVQFKVSFTVIVNGEHKFSGTGTAQDPYLITDFEDLQEIKVHYDNTAETNHEAYYSAHYALINDVNCYDELGGQGYSFAAIGSATHPFKGSITSAGSQPYTISNLRIVANSANLTDGTYTDLSDNYALFGYTDGAEFSNINFENVTIQGGNVNGALIGSGVNTSIQNVNVTNITSEEGAMAGGLIGRAGNNVLISNVTVSGDSSDKAVISAQGVSGGIVADATSASNVTISNVNVQYADISTTSTAGAVYAGGISGAMSGAISGAVVNNCTVNSVYAGGVVGSGTPNNGNNDYGLNATDVAVNACTITSYSSGESAVAAGVLAYSRSSYNYAFENCVVDAATNITANYVAGGIVGKATNSGATYATSLTINNCKSNATLTQTVTYVNETAGEGRYIAGVGSMIALIGQQANMINTSTKEGIFKISNSTAGGVLAGCINVGGVIGQNACQQLHVYECIDPLIDNCIITVSFQKNYDANLRFGVVIGCVETNMNLTSTSIYPDRDDYGALPFNNIYYSSYKSLNFALFGKTTLSQIQSINLAEKIYDLNQARYVLRDTDDSVLATLPIGFIDYKNNVPSQLNITGTDFVFEETFKNNYLASTDSLFGFTIGTESFVLDNISSTDTSKFVVIKDATTGVYKMRSQGNGSANLVFTYTNGLQISLKIMSGISYNGTGEKDEPIQVSSPEIFVYVVNILPSYYYIQTADLDLKNYPIVPMSNMNSVVTPFSGGYDGKGYTISNLTVNGSSSDVGTGIFGTIEGALPDGSPNVSNLTLDNCHVVNGGSNSGMLAGKIVSNATGSPKIENVTVKNSTVSGSGSVGSIAGSVSGSTVINNVSADNVTVAATSGGAGGLFGSIQSSDVQLNNINVDGCIITSAYASESDVAGGIAAFGSGTITGKTEVMQDDEGNDVTVLADAVTNCQISAYTSSGAIGAVYYQNAKDVFSLNLIDIKVSGNNITGSASAKVQSMSTAAGILGLIRADSDINITNCYVNKNNVIFADKYASGVVGRNTSTYFNTLNITDTETYAAVTARQGAGTQMVFASGMIANVYGVDCNIITMSGCVAGGTITASGYIASAGGAIGYMQSTSDEPIDTALFVNGVLSASVYVTDGQQSGIVNAGTNATGYYGKLLAQFEADDLVDDDNFSTVVFKDIYYSSYPQNINFFGQHSVDSFQSIDLENGIPFNNINNSSNFKVSRGSLNGPWNSVAVVNDKNVTTVFYAKFEQTELAYGNGKISTVDPNGFTSSGENNCIVIDAVGDPTYDVDRHITTYELQLRATDYGATRLGAAYTCGLATSVPAISVDMIGDGTLNNPFQVSTSMQLYVVGFLTAGEYYFKQTADIDLSDTYGTDGVNYGDGKGFSPIGTVTYPFQGVYDGQGYKITNLYMNRGADISANDNIGLFGYVDKRTNNLVPTIKNLHVELMESNAALQKANGIVGRNNVGGLVGCANNALIENCSVTKSTVSGNTSVGGLVGSATQSTITYSFVQSDVNAFKNTDGSGKAGGLLGTINNGLNVNGNTISHCYAMGNVYAPKTSTVSDSGNAGGIVGYIENGIGIVIENCLFTGSTSSGHGIYGDAGSTVTASVTSCLDAGQNTAMTNGTYAPIASPVATPSTSSSSTKLSFTDVYYDNALIKAANPSAIKTGIIGSFTSVLTSGSVLTGIGSDNWTYSAGFYPVPQTMADSYAQAYALIASIPVKTSETEESNNSSDYYNYGRGLVYPVTLADKIESYDISYQSSIFDDTDIVPYPEGFDTQLYGIGSNKNTDLLFKDNASENKTTVYRNVFRSGSSNVVVENPLSGSCAKNGEVLYNYQNPVVTASFDVGDITVSRNIKIPLSYATTYFIATERQLFALGLAAYETVSGSKFASYYGSDNNYKLITDIVIDPNSTILFNPIGMAESVNNGAGYTGQFDGSGHKISNLKIQPTVNKTNVGMFATISNNGSISSTYSYIKNLILENATVVGDTNVGILAGTVNNNVTIDGCSSISGSVTATGVNVGGLIGYSMATVNSCYATGNVFTSKLTNSGSSGIGGFIGVMAGGKVTNSFAAGNVELKSFSPITAYSTSYGIGGFVGIVESAVTEISTSFSGGNVTVGTDTVKPSIKPANGVQALVGVGGFSGINNHEVKNCYSSAAVVASFADVYCQDPTATIGLGVGGVCGIAKADVQNVYSSGSVARPDLTKYNSEIGTVRYGIGGSIGTAMGNGALNIANCVFDLWTNTDSAMTSLGDAPDTSANTTNIKSYTTSQLTSNYIPGFDYATTWGHSQGAYPYLTQILKDGVSDQVKASAILSVIAVEPDADDVSARKGHGITMALTVPVTFKYRPADSSVDEIYTLVWKPAGENAGVELNDNKATPIRTKNISEYMVMNVYVDQLKDAGLRTYERLCADMRGTYNQPYLVGTAKDLAHVGMNVAEHQAAVDQYNGLYDQWVTPIGMDNNPTNGIVYYQLMSNIKVSESTISHQIGDLTNTVYYQTDDSIADIPYEGMRLTGNGYSIQNIECTGPYIDTVDEHTTITNIIFENFNITGTDEQGAALIGTNNGRLYDVYLDGNNNLASASGSKMAGLVINNNGLIDGCVADVDITNAYQNVATLALNNNANGVIRNSATAGKIQSGSEQPVNNISGFVGTNSGKIQNSFSMSSISINTPQGYNVTNVAGFCATNKENATINACYTRTPIQFSNVPAVTNTIAAFASKVLGTAETITNVYVAGNLGYYSSGQQSIAFGEVPGNITFNSVYVDKAMSGRTSYNSFKYAVPTVNLVELKNTTDVMQSLFVLDTDSPQNKYPKIKSINDAVNTPLLDENGDPIDYSETDEPVRNFDALKAYTAVSIATVITANSQYIDALVISSSSSTVQLDSTVSRGFTWSVSSDSQDNVVNIVSSTGIMSTTSIVGSAVISPTKSFTLARGKVISPALNISIQTGIANPNFNGGYGTSNSPYVINSANSLQSLIYYGPNQNLNYRLSNDINMSGAALNQIPLFSGKLDGQKFTIYNFNLANGGLFGIMDETSSVKDLALAAFTVNSSNEYTGALADCVRGGTVNNCVSIGTVTGVKNVGGLIGMAYNSAMIKNVITSGKVKGTGTVGGAVGGIVGIADVSTISNVQSSVFVSAAFNGGGIVGELSNGSTMTNVVFSGMANGPAKGSAIAGTNSASTIQNAYYDSQVNISEQAVGITDDAAVNSNIFASTTTNLSKLVLNGFTNKTGYCATPTTLTNATKEKFKALVEFITMNLNFRSGSSKGTVTNYASLTMQGTIRGDGTYENKVLAKEVQLAGQSKYLVVSESTVSGNKFVKVHVGTYDPNIDLTGLNIILNSDNTSIFKDLGDKIFRYIEPRMVRTVNITYTTSGEAALSGKSVGVLIRNKYDDLGNIVGNVNSFAPVGSTVTLDSISVSKTVSGFYVGEMLPDGYAYEITAKDGNNNILTVTKQDGEYGAFVQLGATSNTVSLTVNIVKQSLPWGIHAYRNTLNG